MTGPDASERAQRLAEILPEINEIHSPALREKVIACWLDALAAGGWEPDDLLAMPASLRLADRPFRLVHHVRGVSQMAAAAYRTFQTLYGGQAIRLDPDVLLAGALLHDVGKPVEFSRVDGVWRLSESGRSFRHPFSGFATAVRHEVPPEVLEIVAYHSSEGQNFPRSAENTVIHLVDALNFTPFFAGTPGAEGSGAGAARAPGGRVMTDDADGRTAPLLLTPGDPAHVLRCARERFGVMFQRGLGPLADTTFRIGHLGAVGALDIARGPEALDATLTVLGVPHQRDAWRAAPAADSGGRRG